VGNPDVVPRLRRSDPTAPGIHRRRAGRGFTYLDADGHRVSDAAVLGRIHDLAIPPAWREVWICPWPNGHIQAVGFDAKGRRQYRYHDAWRARRDREKFDRALDLGRALPAVRSRCAELLVADEMTRDRVLACAVRLLDVGFFRVGGEEYAEENGSYGLATLEKSHARVVGEEVVFDYPAKSGCHRVQSVVDPAVRDVIVALKARRGGGRDLLAYREDGRWVDVRSGEINEFLRRLAGIDVTAKDFRTWNATVLAAVALAVSWSAVKSRTARQRAVRRAVGEVASYLGNTPAVCRTSYIDPRVIDRYHNGETIRLALGSLGDGPGPGLAMHGEVEQAVMTLLDPDSGALRAA
jgi:DNA topoisomerase-1